VEGSQDSRDQGADGQGAFEANQDGVFYYKHKAAVLQISSAPKGVDSLVLMLQLSCMTEAAAT
jgi:hypothetical protein